MRSFLTFKIVLFSFLLVIASCGHSSSDESSDDNNNDKEEHLDYSTETKMSSSSDATSMAMKTETVQTQKKMAHWILIILMTVLIPQRSLTIIRKQASVTAMIWMLKWKITKLFRLIFLMVVTSLRLRQ